MSDLGSPGVQDGAEELGPGNRWRYVQHYRPIVLCVGAKKNKEVANARFDIERLGQPGCTLGPNLVRPIRVLTSRPAHLPMRGGCTGAATP